MRRITYEIRRSCGNSIQSNDRSKYHAAPLDPFPEHSVQRGLCLPTSFQYLHQLFSQHLHVAQIKILLTSPPVPVDMPPRDCHVNLSCVGDSHFLREFVHTFSETFRPLADDVKGENNSEESNANQGINDNKVNVTISR